MSKLRDFLIKHSISPDSRFLAAFSGGGDSVFAVLSFIEEGLDVSCAYFQHNLRSDSKKEEEFVREFCGKYGIKLYIGERRGKWQSSIEENARKERYDFFYRIMKEYHYDYLVLGHNKEDVVETFFINLLRTAGIIGLSSIKEFDKERKIIRPFLEFNREEIREYLKKQNIEWYDDPTNREDMFFRNIIRHRLLSVLKEIKNDAIDRIFETTRNLQEYLKVMEVLREKMLFPLPDGGIYLDCKDILEYNNYSILYVLLNDLRMNKNFYKRVFEMCTKKGLSKVCMKGKEVIKGRYGIYVRGDEYVTYKASLKNLKEWCGWRVVIDSVEGYKKDRGERYLYVEDVNDLYVDRIRDVKVKTFAGREKFLREIFSDKKIDHIWMEYLPGIYYNEKLIYVPGVFRSPHLLCNKKCYKIGVYCDAYQKILERREDSEKN